MINATKLKTSSGKMNANAIALSHLSMCSLFVVIEIYDSVRDSHCHESNKSFETATADSHVCLHLKEENIS